MPKYLSKPRFLVLRSLLPMMCLAHTGSASATQVANSFNVSVSQTDNVGSTWIEQDQINDLFVAAELKRSFRKTLGISQKLNYAIAIGGKHYQDFPRSRFNLSAQLGYEKKLGLGFDKPTVGFNWSGTQQFYESSRQNTFNSRFALSYTRPINEVLDFAVELASEWQIPNGQNSVQDPELQIFGLPSNSLDRRWTELKFSSEVFLNSVWSLPLSVSYLDGDLENVSRLRASILNLADAAFRDESLDATQFIYRYDGQAWSTSVAASRLLQNGSTLNFGVNYTLAENPENTSYNQASVSLTWATAW